MPFGCEFTLRSSDGTHAQVENVRQLTLGGMLRRTLQRGVEVLVSYGGAPLYDSGKKQGELGRLSSMLHDILSTSRWKPE